MFFDVFEFVGASMGGQIDAFSYVLLTFFLYFQNISFRSIGSDLKEVDVVKIDDAKKAYKTCVKVDILIMVRSPKLQNI